MRLKHFNLAVGSQLLKAVGDETRIRLLNLLLAKGPMAISDLEHVLDYTQSKTARHITYLKNSGILTYTKHDQWVHYNIKDELTDVITQLLSFFEKDQQLIKDLQTFQALISNRELSMNKIKNKGWPGEKL